MKFLTVFFSLYLMLFSHAGTCSISTRELNDVKFFFKDLITWHDFAYTIYGSKPMSLADYNLKIPSGLPLHRWLRSCYLYMKLKAGLNSWYKNRNEFEFEDFIFLDQEEDLIDCLVLVLINKKNMLQNLHEHENLFKQVLGDSFYPESFLDKLEKRELSLAKAINGSHLLLGIMLGYGERNATLFQERCDLHRALSKRKKENLPRDTELEKRLEFIESLLTDFSDLEEDAILPPLYFFADTSHPETIALKQRYAEDKRMIEQLMQQPKFMDKVLKRLTG